MPKTQTLLSRVLGNLVGMASISRRRDLKQTIEEYYTQALGAEIAKGMKISHSWRGIFVQAGESPLTSLKIWQDREGNYHLKTPQVVVARYTDRNANEVRECQTFTPWNRSSYAVACDKKGLKLALSKTLGEFGPVARIHAWNSRWEKLGVDRDALIIGVNR